jgi:hypothetical protein
MIGYSPMIREFKFSLRHSLGRTFRNVSTRSTPVMRTKAKWLVSAVSIANKIYRRQKDHASRTWAGGERETDLWEIFDKIISLQQSQEHWEDTKWVDLNGDLTLWALLLHGIGVEIQEMIIQDIGHIDIEIRWDSLGSAMRIMKIHSPRVG